MWLQSLSTIISSAFTSSSIFVKKYPSKLTLKYTLEYSRSLFVLGVYSSRVVRWKCMFAVKKCMFGARKWMFETNTMFSERRMHFRSGNAHHQRGPLEHTFLDPFGSSFSAVSKPNFASKYSSESSWRDLQFFLCTIPDFCDFSKLFHHFAKFDAIFVDFQRNGRFCNFSSKFRRFFWSFA